MTERMEMINRVTVSQVPAMPIGDIAALPADQPALLIDDAQATIEAVCTSQPTFALSPRQDTR